MPGKGKFQSLRLNFWKLYPPSAVIWMDRHATARRTHLIGALLWYNVLFSQWLTFFSLVCSKYTCQTIWGWIFCYGTIVYYKPHLTFLHLPFPGGSEGKESACSAGDLGLSPGLGRSPGEGNGNPVQYSHLENSLDRGDWQATVHGVAKSRTQLSTNTHTHSWHTSDCEASFP